MVNVKTLFDLSTVLGERCRSHQIAAAPGALVCNIRSGLKLFVFIYRSPHSISVQWRISVGLGMTHPRHPLRLFLSLLFLYITPLKLYCIKVVSSINFMLLIISQTFSSKIPHISALVIYSSQVFNRVQFWMAEKGAIHNFPLFGSTPIEKLKSLSTVQLTNSVIMSFGW